MSSAQYLLIEVLGLAALYAAEIPSVGKQYAWPAIVCVVAAALKIALPQYVLLHGNLLYLLAIFLGGYLHPAFFRPARQPTKS